MNPVSKVSAAALLALVAIGGLLYAFRGTDGIGGPPTPSPAPTITHTPPSPEATRAPTAVPFVGACLLLTDAEVEDIAGIGGLGARPSELNSGDESTCVYADGGGGVVLRLTLTSPGGAVAFDGLKDVPGIEPVADIGDDALFDPATVNLYALQDDALLLLRANNFEMTPSESLVAERALAALALERL